MALSNLLENAIHGCEALPNEAQKYIRFTCFNVGRLAMEISNPCFADTILNENGQPNSEVEDHGIGTKSVLAFAKKYDGEILYHVEHCVFTVRLLI